MQKKYSGGFALGVILMLIVLIAALVTFASVSGTSQTSFLDREKAKAAAFMIRSQGGAIRDTFRSMVRQGQTATSIDYAPTCTGQTKCIMSKADSGLALKNLDSRYFSDVAGQLNSYELWRFDNRAALSPSTDSAVVVLMRPLKSEICLAIESSVRNRPVTDTSSYESLSLLSFATDGTAEIAFSNLPQRSDGCAMDSGGSDLYYFMILGGNKSS